MSFISELSTHIRNIKETASMAADALSRIMHFWFCNTTSLTLVKAQESDTCGVSLASSGDDGHRSLEMILKHIFAGW